MANQFQFPSNVHVSTHPCVRAKLSQLRSSSTNARDTKILIHEIATLVGCEALAHGLTNIQTGTVSFFSLQDSLTFLLFNPQPSPRLTYIYQFTK